MSANLLFDGTFWLSITTLVLGALALIVKTCYKSKCKDFNCCYGLLEIQRDTNVEEHIDIEDGTRHRSDYIPERN
jgi:hypothetical protein